MFSLALQILFVPELHHWIACSMLDRDVMVYDSLSSLPLPTSVEKQLFQLFHQSMPRKSTGLLVTSVPVQQQTGIHDCGLYAIATAFHIAAGDKISELAFEQSKLRQHLAKCFEKKRFSRFPIAKKHVAKSAEEDIYIPTFCRCRMPDSMSDMIMCSGCECWLHFKCACIRKAPLDDWYCNDCTK